MILSSWIVVTLRKIYKLMRIIRYKMIQNKPNIEAVISDCYCGRLGTIQYFVGDVSRGEGPVYDVRFCSGIHRQIWISYGDRESVFSEQKLQLEDSPNLQAGIAYIIRMYEEDSLARMEPHYPLPK